MLLYRPSGCRNASVLPKERKRLPRNRGTIVGCPVIFREKKGQKRASYLHRSTCPTIGVSTRKAT